jgi:ribonuclease III
MNTSRKEQLRNLLQSPIFGITDISNKALDRYDQALTHGSYRSDKNVRKDFERLSFLGNYVLDFIVPEYIYDRYPDASPGFMKPFVESTRNRKLSKIGAGKTLGINDAVLVGNGTGMTDDIKADAFEAFVAAMYLDQGIEKTRETIINLFRDEFEKLEAQDPESRKSWKNRLGEYVQQTKKTEPKYDDPLPIQITNKEGVLVWHAWVKVNGEIWGEGEGERIDGIESASDNAAKNAFKKHCTTDDK